MDWLRLYTEWMADPVVQSLSFEDQRHHIVVLCCKRSGILDRGASPAQLLRMMSTALRVDESTASDIRRRLMDAGLIDKKWQPKGWKKRQFESDNVTARTRKYRKNKETGNVPGTPQERSGNAPDTDTDTDPYTSRLQGLNVVGQVATAAPASAGALAGGLMSKWRKDVQ